MAGTYPPKQFQPPEVNPYHVGYDQTEDGKPLEGYQSRSGTIDKRNCPLIKQPEVEIWIPPRRDYMMWSILTCIFCFMPTGVVAVYNAHKADQAFKEGNLLYGEHCQTIAKKFIIISVIIGSCVLIGLSVMLGVLYSG